MSSIVSWYRRFADSAFKAAIAASANRFIAFASLASSDARCPPTRRSLFTPRTSSVDSVTEFSQLPWDLAVIRTPTVATAMPIQIVHSATRK